MFDVWHIFFIEYSDGIERWKNINHPNVIHFRQDLKIVSMNCWLVGFRDWWLAKNEEWPVRPNKDFHAQAYEYAQTEKTGTFQTTGALKFWQMEWQKGFFWEKKVRPEFDEVAFCWLFWWLLISSCYWFDCELKTNRNSINNMNWRCQQHVCRGPPCHSCCIELRLPLVRRWPKAHSNVFSALWLQYGDETTTCLLLRISLVNQFALWIHKWKVHEWILDVYIYIWYNYIII